MDAALDRIKKQESVISVYEEKMAFVEDIQRNADGLMTEVDGLRKQISVQNEELLALRRLYQKKICVIVVILIMVVVYTVYSLLN